jgi:hypothetical protein
MSDSTIGGLLLRDQANGTNLGLWGGYTDDNLTMVERALTQLETYTVTGNTTIVWTEYAINNAFVGSNIIMTGPSGSQTLTAAATLSFPAYRSNRNVFNDTGQDITFEVSGGATITLKNNHYARIASDGTDHFIYSATQFATGLYVNGKIENLTAGTAGTDATNLTQVNALIAAGAIPGATGTVKVDAAATAGYLGAVLTGSGDVTLTDNGDTLDIGVTVPAVDANWEEALAGKLTGTLSSGTTAMTANRRYRISSTATGTLPTLTSGQAVIVEFTVGSGITGTVGRNSQTIDGVSEDDTYIGDGASGPIIMYSFASAGVVTSTLIGSTP